MPKCDGDPRYRKCDRGAIFAERDIETKRIVRYVCQGHAYSFNPYTEFVLIAEQRKKLLAELEACNPHFSRYTPIAQVDKLSLRLPQSYSATNVRSVMKSFDGVVDEVAVHDKVLSASEIQERLIRKDRCWFVKVDTIIDEIGQWAIIFIIVLVVTIFAKGI